MFVKKKKFAELEKRVEALEKGLKIKPDVQDTEAVPSEHEAVEMAQIMDEWLNGKKGGSK